MNNCTFKQKVIAGFIAFTMLLTSLSLTGCQNKKTNVDTNDIPSVSDTMLEPEKTLEDESVDETIVVSKTYEEIADIIEDNIEAEAAFGGEDYYVAAGVVVLDSKEISEDITEYYIMGEYNSVTKENIAGTDFAVLNGESHQEILTVVDMNKDDQIVDLYTIPYGPTFEGELKERFTEAAINGIEWNMGLCDHKLFMGAMDIFDTDYAIIDGNLEPLYAGETVPVYSRGEGYYIPVKLQNSETLSISTQSEKTLSLGTKKEL